MAGCQNLAGRLPASVQLAVTIQSAPVTDNEIAAHPRVGWLYGCVVSCDNALPCAVHVRRLLLLLVGRPGDVLQTRSGITVENGNTDAEVGWFCWVHPVLMPPLTPAHHASHLTAATSTTRVLAVCRRAWYLRRGILPRAIRSFAV